MPFTFFAHQVFVLPFKEAKPRWFDGTALCVGSMAPDFAYALMHTPLALSSHRFRAQLYWTVPLAWALTWLIRQHLAEPIGAQLPGRLGAQVQALARTRHAGYVTAWSALLGGLTHIVVDAFTHGHGWAYDHIALLRHVLYAQVTVADGLQYVGHTLGTAVGVAWMWGLIKAQRISEWNGHPPGASSTRYTAAPWFWPVLLRGSALCGLSALIVLAATRDISIAIMRGSLLELLLLIGLAFALRRSSGIRVAE